MPQLRKDFGEHSVVSQYRYDDAPALAQERRGCVVSIAESRGSGKIFCLRLEGYTAAVSNLHHGTHVRLFEADDPQTEFGRYKLVAQLEGQSVELLCAEIEEL